MTKITDERGERRKKYKREISAGGIVFRRKGKTVQILLIGKTQKGKRIWIFPKGWIEKGETDKQAALREVREESGVDAEIVHDLGSIKYIFRWEGENIFKIVKYYLMKYVSGDPKDHDFEVEEAKWFSLEEAGKVLIYRTDKDVFERACKVLAEI